MRRVLVGASVMLTGCLSQSGFIDRFTEAECAFLMECYDEAILNFKGWNTVEDCIAEEGTRVATEADGCEMDRRSAQDCLSAMDDATCPAEPSEFELPAICDQVFVECGADSGDSSDTADTGA